ncbi:MAG: hypothetical protein ACE15C_08430 [Phycisphaerae bacterium]
MRSRLMSIALVCLWCGLACAFAGGCGHGGIVHGVVPSKDGRVVMYHGENAGEGVFVADGRGAVRVGDDGTAYLSADGRYVFLVPSDVNGPRWPGRRLILYDVARRSQREGSPVPRALYAPQSLAAESGWEPALTEVYLDAGPSVVMGVRMVKFNEDPPRTGPVQYIRWTPGGGCAAVAGPQGTACLNKAVDVDASDSWVVVRRAGNGQPYRTVWVHPDGNVIELLRNTQGFGRSAFTIGMFPIFFWAGSYWRMASWLDEQNHAAPQLSREEELRIQRLVQLRKGASSRP